MDSYLGITSDQENLNSKSNTNSLAIIPPYGTNSIGCSPSLGVQSSVNVAYGPYFAEFSRTQLGSKIDHPSIEFLDLETACNPTELNRIKTLLKKDAVEKSQIASNGEALNIENVSNVAFFDYTYPNSIQFQTSASVSTSNTSPLVNERDFVPAEGQQLKQAKEEATKFSGKAIKNDSEIIGKEISTNTNSQITMQRQPFSYKEALEMNVLPGSGKQTFMPRGRADNNAMRAQGYFVARSRANLKDINYVDDEESSGSSNGKKKKSGSSGKRRSAKKQVEEETGKPRANEVVSNAIIVSQQQQQQIMRYYQSGPSQNLAISQVTGLTANTGTVTPGNRVPASPNDICKIISKSVESRAANHADRSGSDISNMSRQGSSNKATPITKMRQIQHEIVIPDDAIPYSTWQGNFRMPSAYAPKTGQNVFKFPFIPRSDSKFVAQLEEFRKSLQTFEGNPIEGCKFKDFQPKLNFFTYTSSTPKQSDKKLFTNSPPIKVFDAPPVRAWIPVRCDALGVDLRHERNVDGHAGKGGGKAQVSVVYDANKSTTERKVLYIRKEYYDLEYFTNEYNFLQFANHQHLPKPLCVEYDPYPKIVMDYVPGDRVHVAFYHLGISFKSEYPNDTTIQRKKLSTALSKVLAKILITIKYIHSIGFIHADLKPENIIYDLKSGRIAIIDFDLSVSAPYAFTGRGTEATVAPEVNGLLKGPVHFGIDWWAYGSTAAMMIAAALAGLCHDIDPVVEQLIHYVPFKYDRSTNQYEMTPIPKYFSPVMRSFLYPFFNPDPSRRVFAEANAYNWIRSHVMFECVENWVTYEQVNLGAYASLSPIQLGFMNFSHAPRLLKPVNRVAKLFSGFSQMWNVFGGGGSASKSETAVVSKAEEEEDEEEDEYSVQNDEDQNYHDNIFVLDP